MRSALITNSRIPSLTANSIQAMKVAQGLIDLGHMVRVFAPAEGEAPTPEQLIVHYGLHTAPFIKLLPSIRGLKRLDFIFHARRAAKKFNANLIYTWLPQSAALGLRGGLPVVLEMHADVAGRFGAWWLRQFWVARGRKLMTVTTHALRLALEQSALMDFPDDSVLIAANAVDLDRYENLPAPEAARRELRLPEGPTVGFTGHIYPGRGAHLLFELARQLPEAWFLWVGGTPELVEFWRTRLAADGLHNVVMTGFVDQQRIPLHQAAADLLLMPYGRVIQASSGQDIGAVINPMKMFEYMAAGRAIVSADLPSIREVLNEKNAVLCPPAGEAIEAGRGESRLAHTAQQEKSSADSEHVIAQWKAAIEGLLHDSAKRAALGAQARRDVEKFSWVEREKRILERIAM